VYVYMCIGDGDGDRHSACAISNMKQRNGVRKEGRTEGSREVRKEKEGREGSAKQQVCTGRSNKQVSSERRDGRKEGGGEGRNAVVRASTR